MLHPPVVVNLVLLFSAASGLEILPPWARGGSLHAKLSAERTERGRGGLVYGAPVGSDGQPTQHITVPLDWFNTSAYAVGKTFEIRYWVDDSCWDRSANGPLFVHMGGEGAAGGVHCGTEEKKFGALAVGVEHRYYGASQPRDGLTDLNMPFLSVEQNLADTAAIVRYVLAHLPKASASASAATVVTTTLQVDDTLLLMRERSTPRTASASAPKVIAWGGSYSGATCAWFRTTYPALIDGCVSSSGVVDAREKFSAFDTHIHDALALKSPACAAALRAATDAVDRAFAQGTKETKRVKELFNASNLVGTKLGNNDFYYAIADAPAMLDQYGNKDALCTSLASIPTPPSGGAITDEARLTNLAATIEKHYGPAFVSGCFYDSECVKTVPVPGTMEQGVGNRQWRWQKCTELAYLQSYPEDDDSKRIRSKALSFRALLEQCEYVFGVSAVVTPAKSAAFAKRYGGARPDHVGASRIVFLDFSDDPWSEVSVQKTLSKDLPYCMTTCDGCGHCGAGVPKNLTKKCDDVVETNVKMWLE